MYHSENWKKIKLKENRQKQKSRQIEINMELTQKRIKRQKNKIAKLTYNLGSKTDIEINEIKKPNQGQPLSSVG